MPAPQDPSRPARRGRPGHDLAALLDASVALFCERGFDGTSMQDLADRLGVSKAALYHHIPSKDALLGRALDHALSGLEEAAARVREAPGSALDRLQLLLQTSFEVLVDRLPYVTLLLRVRGNTPIEQQALVRRRRLDRLAAELIGGAVELGELRPDLDARLTARLLFGTVNSVVEWLRPGDGPIADELAGAAIALLLDGLRPR